MPTTYAVVKAWRKENPEKVKAQSQRYAKRHPEVLQATALRWRANHLEEIREKDKLEKRAYRETEKYKEEARVRQRRYVERRIAEQTRIAGRPKPGLCEICCSAEFRIVWDHCHTKGHFRGWICDRCNRVLGIVRDDVNLLRTLANYLETPNGSAHNSGEKQITGL